MFFCCKFKRLNTNILETGHSDITINYIETGTNVILYITQNLPYDIIGDVFVYGMLCGLTTAVAVKLWNKLCYCRIHGCYTEREMSSKCCC